MWDKHVRRPLFVVLGSLFFAVGLLGVFLPVLPTTPFMLLALWAFSIGSQRLHDYLWNHPRFGPPLRDWTQHGIVPRKAKISAVSIMSLSAAYLVFLSDVPTWAVASACITMLCSGSWLCLRPEES